MNKIELRVKELEQEHYVIEKNGHSVMMQRLNKDGFWYAIYGGRIINWGRYSADIEEWLDQNVFGGVGGAHLLVHVRKGTGFEVKAFMCPACKEWHTVHIGGSWWQQQGTDDKPSLFPSVLARGYSKHLGVTYLCHSYVEEGMVRFLDDCTHGLKGQVVPMVPVTSWYNAHV